MWKKILEELKKTENENLIKTFISPLYPMQESRDEIVLCCRSSIAYDFLNKNKYLNKITSIAQTLFEQNTKVKIIIKQDDDDEKIQKGEQLPALAGIPLALNDNINLKGV